MKQEYIEIHNALHDGREVVPINSTLLTISRNGSGCRYCIYDGYMFMEQNKRKPSKWAERARNGENITWGIPHYPDRTGSWILVTDDTLPDE